MIMAMHLEALTAPVSDADRLSLERLLIDCVAGGASIGFLHPLPVAEAEAYWRRILGELTEGRRLLWVARGEDGGIVGSVQLALESRPNGRHRAEVQKLMVLQSGRGRGLGKRLMAALEIEAKARGLRLLFLDTSEGRGGAADFYFKQGYAHAGGIPEYALDPDGKAVKNAIFYKLLETRS